jgi:hypothetical protein
MQEARERGQSASAIIRHKMEYSRNVSQKVMVITLESDRNW